MVFLCRTHVRKRFGRIYWPMAIVCLATAVWMLYQGKDVLMPLLGNMLLFKMFVPELESSMGGQMWFISTIIQFYFAWPLIVRLINIKRGTWIAIAVSLLWAEFVYLTGHSEERVWNSFFLQYLWEFCLGMKLAELYVRKPSALDLPKWKYLVPVCVSGMAVTGAMGWMGFPWKLFNDIPSLFGYISLALIIYKLHIVVVNRFFSYANRFSYEWYLVHILVFQIVMQATKGHMPAMVEIVLCLLLSYFAAMLYGKLWNRKKTSK